MMNASPCNVAARNASSVKLRDTQAARRHGWLSVVAVLLLGAGAPYASAQIQRVLGLDISARQGNISQTTWNNLHNVENRQFMVLRSSRGGTTGYYDQNDAPNNNGLNTLSQRYDDPYAPWSVADSVVAPRTWQSISRQTAAVGASLRRPAPSKRAPTDT
jgi:hypothetical protein